MELDYIQPLLFPGDLVASNHPARAKQPKQLAKIKPFGSNDPIRHKNKSKTRCSYLSAINPNKNKQMLHEIIAIPLKKPDETFEKDNNADSLIYVPNQNMSDRVKNSYNLKCREVMSSTKVVKNMFATEVLIEKGKKQKLNKIAREGIPPEQIDKIFNTKRPVPAKKKREYGFFLIGDQLVDFDSYFDEVKKQSVRTKNHHMRNLNSQVKLTFEEPYQLSNQANFSQKYRTVFDKIDINKEMNDIVLETDEIKAEIKLEKTALEKEVEEVLEVQDDELTRQMRKKSLITKFKRAIRSALYDYKRQKLTYEELFSNKHNPSEPFEMPGSELLIKSVRFKDLDNVVELLKENKFLVNNFDTVAF